MRCLLITIKRNRRGLPIREGRIVTGDVLTIGRGSDCSIYLPNARVTLHHATLHTQEDGRLVIEANSTEIGVDGAFVQRARLRPDTRISIGPYEMVVELAGAEGYPEHDFALTVELSEPVQTPRAKRRNVPTTLAGAGLSKRRPALLLALLVGLLFLALPILHAVEPSFRAMETELSLVPVAADESWSPGLLAGGHRGFGHDCASCHTIPFEHVQDRPCLSCHAGTGPHVRNATLQTAAFGTTRCAECHRDHRGVASMNDIDPVLCSDCHGAIRSRAPNTLLPNISDFKADHPAFRLTIATGPLPTDIVRVSESDRPAPQQHTGLKFPHDVHLARIGVESHNAPPGQNGRVVLQCKNCHAAEASGVGFEPISMERHCADCHRLEFEPDVTSRQVPHGSERNVMLALREFYASAALGSTPLEVTTVDGMLPRPGAHPVEIRRRAALDWANEKAGQVATDLFEVRVCVVCHEVRRRAQTPDEVAGSSAPIAVPWKVDPVFLTQHWMPAARFQHDKHAAVDCVQCHAVTQSRSGTDVSMPTIGKCRECHVGNQPERNKISSNCELCHGFHQHLVPSPGTAPAGLVAIEGREQGEPLPVPDATQPAAIPKTVATASGAKQ